MKKFMFIIAASVIALAVMAQGKTYNDPNAEVRNVRSFHAIRISSGIRLYLTQGNQEAVAVSASEREYRDRIKTEVTDGGTLKIYYDNKWNDWSSSGKELKAYVSCKDLDALTGNAGAHVEVDGTVHSNKLKLDFSSGASFKGAVSVTDLTAETSSGAHSVISGTASSIRTEASSGSHLDADDLQVDNADAQASSGAKIELNVNKELSASASSGGHIHYKGNAVIKELDTGSGGGVSKR
ncbi:MAG TPA: head GIN domain-containing protein [Puia sp.]|nr:head GIN domain-containing protein [Puia sp.]